MDWFAVILFIGLCLAAFTIVAPFLDNNKEDKDMYQYEYKFIQSSGTNQYVDSGTWLLPSGMAYSENQYEFPFINQLMKDDNIIKYVCNRCGSKLLVNKEKLPAVMSLICLSCSSPDLEEIK